MKLKISAIVALIGLSLSALGLGRLLNREETILLFRTESCILCRK